MSPRNKGVILAANGHGGVVALKSLQAKFEKIYLLSDDYSLVKMLRKNDVEIDSFEDSDEELVVCAAYSKIINKDILDKKTIINTHPSLLPKYRGIHSLAWAMLNLETEVGFSIHLMDEWIDNGPILAQYKVEVGDQTSKEIMDRFDQFILEELGNIVEGYILGEIKPQEQDFSKASWCCRRNLDDCILDFELSHQELLATFKALVEPYPLPMISIDSELYELTDVEIIEDNMVMHTGRIINLQEGIAYIKTKESIIKVKNLRRQYDKKLIAPDVLLKFGMRLKK